MLCLTLTITTPVESYGTYRTPPPLPEAPSFARSKRFSLPYRLPTKEEYRSNTPIMVSSEPINEHEYIVDKNVLGYLEEHKYLRKNFTQKWEMLRTKQTLTPSQAIEIVRFQIRIKTALERFQMDRKIPVTGVMDGNVMEVIYGQICGTPEADVVDDIALDEFIFSVMDSKKNVQ